MVLEDRGTDGVDQERFHGTAVLQQHQSDVAPIRSQFLPKWQSTFRDLNKNLFSHIPFWLAPKLSDACPRELESSPEPRVVVTSWPSGMSRRGIRPGACYCVSPFYTPWGVMSVLHHLFKERRSLAGTAPLFTFFQGPIFFNIKTLPIENYSE